MLLLVLVVVGVALVLGSVFLAASTTTTGTARIVGELTQARQAAESGIALAIGSIDRAPSWDALPADGVWLPDFPVSGGLVTVSAARESGDAAATPSVQDPSFESAPASLPKPLISPPMSGTLGSWQVQRTALVVTGLTVPTVEIVANDNATDGTNVARIAFSASVVGTAVFRQEVAERLDEWSRYRLIVDIGTGGLPALNESFGVRLYAGGALVVSTEEAFVVTDLLTQENIESLAETLQSETLTLATLISTLIGPSRYEYQMEFMTDGDPPAGPVIVELFAESLGLLSAVTFDHVRLTAQNDRPFRLTAVGRVGDAAWSVTSTYARGLSGHGRITQWSEP